jgi:hypothetical protein
MTKSAGADFSKSVRDRMIWGLQATKAPPVDFQIVLAAPAALDRHRMRRLFKQFACALDRELLVPGDYGDMRERTTILMVPSWSPTERLYGLLSFGKKASRRKTASARVVRKCWRMVSGGGLAILTKPGVVSMPSNDVCSIDPPPALWSIDYRIVSSQPHRRSAKDAPSGLPRPEHRSRSLRR